MPFSRISTTLLMLVASRDFGREAQTAGLWLVAGDEDDVTPVQDSQNSQIRKRYFLQKEGEGTMTEAKEETPLERQSLGLYKPVGRYLAQVRARVVDDVLVHVECYRRWYG